MEDGGWEAEGVGSKEAGLVHITVMRRKMVLGNWKMNLTSSESKAVIQEFLSRWEFNENVRVGFAPSYLSVETVKTALGENSIWTGGQDCLWAEKGAFTGCVSVPMLADAGAEFCLVGHSERRGRFGKLETPESTIAYFAESDETANLKIKALTCHGISAILCVGETLAEREDGHTDSTIAAQIQGALATIDQESAALVTIAYEPVWAIGTGKVCDAKEANRVCGVIRKVVESLLGEESADAMRILYGGSVKASNAQELFSQDSIDGGLVGGASLDPIEFADIVATAGAL